MMTFVGRLAKFLRRGTPRSDRSSRASLPFPRGLPLVAVLSAELPAYADRSILTEAAERTHWELQIAPGCEEAWRLADRLRAPVILYDRDIQETEWREAVGILSSLAHRPMVILISRVADEYLWNELFRIGGFDVLRKPLRREEISRVLSLALSYWRSEAHRAKPVKQAG